jgi:tetratricopeptide (TPR) repeat protein
MQILERGNNYSFAYDLLCQQTRYREAFELADKVRDLPKHSLQIPRARTLHQLGEVEKAHAVLKEYAPAWERRITAKAEEGERKIHYSDLTDLPAAEYKLGMHDEALAHIDKLMLLFPNDAANIISAVLYTDDGRTALWWRVLREQHAKEAVAKSLERLHALKQKRMPAAEFEAMVRTAVPWLKTSKRETDLEPLAGICEDMKRDDLARLCLDKLGDGADQWLPLGHFLLKKKAWDEAAAVFAKVCAKQKDSAEAHFLRGWAMVKAGHEEEGRRWMEIGHWLPLGRDAGHYALALALDQHDLAGEAPRQWDLPRQLGSDDEFFVLHFALTQASRRATRLHKYDEALRLAERSDLGVLYGGISYIDNKSWIAKPHQTLVIRALANIQAHQFDAAQRTIKIASELMPGNVELPLACVPAFQKEGRARDADALFDQCFAHLRQLCKEYPRSGEFNNNVAWLAASCRRQLDPALEHARKAVELAPQNAGFIDTLAEVHFQRGDRKRALELIAQAIAIDPNYNYFRHQQQRFTAGDRAAPIPED